MVMYGMVLYGMVMYFWNVGLDEMSRSGSVWCGMLHSSLT